MSLDEGDGQQTSKEELPATELSKGMGLTWKAPLWQSHSSSDLYIQLLWGELTFGLVSCKPAEQSFCPPDEWF